MKEVIKKKENITIKEFIQYIWWSIKFNTSVSTPLTVTLLLIQITFELFPIITSLSYARVFAKLAQLLLEKATFEAALKELTPLLIIVFSIDVILSLFSIARAYINTRLKRIRRTIIDKRYIEKYSNLSIEQLDSPDLANLLKRAEDNFWRLEDINTDIMEYISGLIGGITSVIIMLNYEPIIVLIAIVLVTPIVIKDIKYNKDIKRASDGFSESWREYWTGRWMLTNKSTLVELVVQNLQHKLTKYLFDFRDRVNHTLLQIDNFYTKIDAFARLNQLYSVLGFILIIKKVISVGGDIGNITFYTDQISRINTFFSVLIRDIVYLYDQMRYIKEIKEFFELKMTAVNGTKKLVLKGSPTIEFVNVSFKYPRAKSYAIRNLSLLIKPNEEIALVGENGAGKSTLIKLLLRFYDPTEGKILINGLDLKSLDIKTYYNYVSALFQDYNYVGFLTMKENIEFAGTKNSTLTHIQAAKMADIDKAIMKLPKKYDTKSYSYFDGGVELSQGQSQKLVIARAFYRNAPILILDEPTASIDAVAESKIFNRIYRFMKKKTVIIISHRFSTVRNAKKIYVLDKGNIVESGTHEELLNIEGLYKKSFDLQAKGYQK